MQKFLRRRSLFDTKKKFPAKKIFVEQKKHFALTLFYEQNKTAGKREKAPNV